MKSIIVLALLLVIASACARSFYLDRILADIEEEAADQRLFSTRAYPSDGDWARAGEDDEESDMLYTTMKYPSDSDSGFNTVFQTNRYPSDSDAGLKFDDEDDEEADAEFLKKLKLGNIQQSFTKAYPSDSDLNRKPYNMAFDDVEEDDDSEETDMLLSTMKYPSDADADLTAGLRFTKAYPSDSDVKRVQTMMYPSDGDFARDEEDDDEESDQIMTTMKYPSDSDNSVISTRKYPSDYDNLVQTMKYPSDADAQALFDDEDEEADFNAEFLKKFTKPVYVTKMYPSDGDLNTRPYAFDDSAEDDEDEEADLSPIFTTQRYPSDSDSASFTKMYPSDSDNRMQTKKYPSDADPKVAFDDEEDSE